MSTSQSRGGGERMIHQDFIARIRFSNALPPPPNPPKLLDIPNTGLASGQYTTPGFASRLAREQPLNIEADAELGMPLDLVGMPGIFDGDESSIQAPAVAPHVHPHDRALLRPLATLGKPKTSDTTVSFLRRTEYISSGGNRHRFDAGPLRAGSGNTSRRPEKRKSPEPDAGTPAYVKRKIEKSFDAAALALTKEQRARAKHPSKKTLKLVDAMPLLPDLNAFPDSGTYVTIKFRNHPVPSSSTYDTRLLSGIFHAIDPTEAEQAAIDAAQEAYDRDPAKHTRPSNPTNYGFFLPDSVEAGENYRKRLDVDNPDRDDPDLYVANGKPSDSFRFRRLRKYETYEEQEFTHATKYSKELLLAYGPNSAAGGQNAAWYYPVMQRTEVRTQRDKTIARSTMGATAEDAQQTNEPEEFELKVTDPSEDLLEHVKKFEQDPLYDPQQDTAAAETEEGARDGADADEDAEGEEDREARGDADSDVEARAYQRRRGSSSEANGRDRSVDADEPDAEGDEEE